MKICLLLMLIGVFIGVSYRALRTQAKRSGAVARDTLPA